MGAAALVLRVDRKRVVVELPDGRVVDAQTRGALHRDVGGRRHGRTKNPIAVGDLVEWDEPTAGDVVVTGVEPRRSALIRPEVAGRWRRQVLVANADRAVLVFAHADPMPRAGLVDRLLVACHAGRVPPVLVFNKLDLAAAEETALLIAMYARLGYEVLRTCADTGEGVDELAALLHGRRSVFAGPSGAGKSSLINRALPGVTLRTGEISRTTGKGRHTTTAAQLVRLPAGAGHVIDTPGIKEFGLSKIPAREVELHFPEFPVPGRCRFDDCRHDREPGCAVREAVESGEVAESRFHSYTVFRAELEEAERTY